MILQYIVIDEIISLGEFNISIWRISPEVSIKAVKIKEVNNIKIISIIDYIERFIAENSIKELTILGSRDYFENFFDNNIDDFKNIKIKFNENTGYSVKFSAPANNEYKSYYLLDTSAYGFQKAFTKLVQN